MSHKFSTSNSPEWISNLAYAVRRWWHLKVRQYPMMRVSEETLENFKRLENASGFTAEEAHRLFGKVRNHQIKANHEQ